MLALGLFSALLGLTGFTSRDPDSALHAAIVARTYDKPVAEWIAPQWGTEWNRTDLYREHPAGIFLLPAVLARLGYPPWQAAYAVNAVYQALTVLMICLLGARLIPRPDARALSWLLLLMPIAFTYRIRANHEQPILLLVLVALYATERSGTRLTWLSGLAGAAIGAFLIKGVFVLPVLASCAAWLLVRPPPARAARAAAWFGLLGAAAVVVLAGVAYEYVYREVTSDTFFGFYLRQQLGLAAAAEGEVLPQKIRNLLWYAARLLWFPFPWSLLLVGLALTHRRVRDRAHGAIVPALVLAAAVWPLMFSLSDRRADRYIFPAYFLIGAAGACLALGRSAALGRTIQWISRAYPYEQVLVWSILTALSLLATLARLPRIR